MVSPSTGYSGTPLAKKLGIVAHTRLVTINAPPHYLNLLELAPVDIVFEKKPSAVTDIVHLFSTEKSELEAALKRLRKTTKSNGVIWVSWPKKAAKVPTDITEDTIRTLALPLGFVDVKVCAVDAVWSGLKLVIRKELRAAL
jgi:hypothetical protein